jgi:hypothetical protein
MRIVPPSPLHLVERQPLAIDDRQPAERRLFVLRCMSLPVSRMAALSGPTVCELEGPMPIRNTSKTL